MTTNIMEPAGEPAESNVFPGDVIDEASAEKNRKDSASAAADEIAIPPGYESDDADTGDADTGDDSNDVKDQGDDPESGEDGKEAEGQPEFDESLLAQARDWDVSEDELREMGAERAGQMLNRMDKAHMKRARKDAATSPATTDDKSSKSDEAEPPAAYEPPEIEEEMHDPEIVARIKYQDDFIKRQNERLAKLEASRQDAEPAAHLPGQQDQQALMESFEKLIADVGNPELFGEGATLELDPSSGAHRRRLTLAQAMDEFESIALSRDPEKKPDMAVLFRRALQSEFESELKEQAQKSTQLAKKREKWDGAKSSKPATRERRAAPVNPNDPEAVRKAQLQAVREVKRKYGIDTD